MDQKKGAQVLTQTQFVGALLRLASQMYVGNDPIDEKLTRLCNDHIAGHVYDELQLVKDSHSTIPCEHAKWGACSIIMARNCAKSSRRTPQQTPRRWYSGEQARG